MANRMGGAMLQVDSAQPGSVQHSVLRNSYLLLAMSLIPTIIGTFFGLQFNWSALGGSPIISTLLMMAVVYGLMFAVQANAHRGLGVGLLMLFTFVMGVFLGPLLQVALSLKNGAALVAYAASSTAIIFMAISAWITSTGKDLSGMGKFLMAGIIVLLLAMVVNIFAQLPVLSLVISAAFALFSVMAIAYTVSAAVNGGETNYILVALSIYIHLYNLFTSLLSLLMAFAGNRE